jgi:acetyltransferase-like isoleucine patch superfamily enzyme
VRPAALVRLAVQSLRCRARLRRHGARCSLVTCEGRLPVVHGGGRIRVGRLALRGATVAVELGARSGGELTIGDRTFVNQGASLVARCGIAIGEDTRIGDGVAIYDSNHHPLEEGAEVHAAPVRVGRNVWLGRGAIVLPGVTVGDHSVVAAGAVVGQDVPPRALVAGNPARVVRELHAGDGWRTGGGDREPEGARRTAGRDTGRRTPACG